MSRRASGHRQSLGSVVGGRPRARPLTLVAVAVAATCLTALVTVLVYVAFTLQSPDPPSLELGVSDGIAYATHAALGSALNAVSISPQAATIQWLKAASHARSDAEVQRAGSGIERAVANSRSNRSVLQTICLIDEEGSPAVDQAVSAAHVTCPGD